MPDCSSGSWFLGDYSKPYASVLIDHTGSVTPLDTGRVHLSVYAGDGLIYFTNDGGKSVMSFDLNNPSAEADFVAKMGGDTFGLTMDTDRQRLFVGVSGCCIKGVLVDGTDEQTVVSEVSESFGLAVDSVNT